MTLLAVAVSAMLVQAPAPPSPRPLNCNPPPDEAAASFCAAEDTLRQGDRAEDGDEARDAARTRAVSGFRRAADLTGDPVLKKHALEQLERLYDADHLDLPREAEGVIRQLVTMSGNDVSPMFRLARLQEREELFDAAESTLLAARQQKPDDIAPYRELAQFFARRAAALSADKDRQDRADRPADPAGKPDKDGVYRLGGSVQPPEQISAVSVPMPSEAIASGVTGSVAIEVVVDETGRVTGAKILRSVPVLDATALATVTHWRFAPAMLDGRTVPVRMTVVVRFGG